MSQRLNTVQEWETLAKVAQYRAHELAGVCQVSLRTLQRHFRSHYGLKVSHWLRDVRLREAYARLLQGFSVKEVAFDLGYKQLSHFSRDFKSHFGVSPSYLCGVPSLLELPSRGLLFEPSGDFQKVLAV